MAPTLNDFAYLKKVQIFPSIFLGKCPDTYEVALFAELFCDHLVEEAESSKEW